MAGGGPGCLVCSKARKVSSLEFGWVTGSTPACSTAAHKIRSQGLLGEGLREGHRPPVEARHKGAELGLAARAARRANASLAGVATRASRPTRSKVGSSGASNSTTLPNWRQGSGRCGKVDRRGVPQSRRRCAQGRKKHEVANFSSFSYEGPLTF
jgi:hypothetical protein